MPDINQRRRRHLSSVVQGFPHRAIGRVETMIITASDDENASGVGAQAHDK
jgi:hypothetical protein